MTRPGGDPNGAPMKKIILILTALAFATPASAEWSRTWSCDNGMIDVTLVKHATKAFELNFSGSSQLCGRTAMANRKRRLTFFTAVANAAPIEFGQIEVLDGDTIRIAGETFRLVGSRRAGDVSGACLGRSGSLATGRHFGFGSLWPVAVSILNASRVPAGRAHKARPGAIMVALAAFSERQDVMSPTCWSQKA